MKFLRIMHFGAFLTDIVMKFCHKNLSKNYHFLIKNSDYSYPFAMAYLALREISENLQQMVRFVVVFSHFLHYYFDMTMRYEITPDINLSTVYFTNER